MSGTVSAQQAATSATEGNNFPWAGQPDEIACNFAFGLIMRNLPPRIANDKNMHAPTLMAAAGAVAGVCAQISLLADAERIEKARAEGRIKEMALKDGRIFLFGDALNEMLYSVRDADVARSRVWNMLVTAALKKGLEREALPNVPAMFRHVNESFDSVVEGMPSVPQNAQPLAPVHDLLKLVGPIVLTALAGDLPPALVVKGQDIRANRKSWVAITAQVAGNLLMTASRVMPPAMCLTIAMESAIYASKLSTNVVQQAPKPTAQA
ncbi:MAG: hypothetical protein ABMA14_11105 [Hyphomonadaceae bacterium]